MRKMDKRTVKGMYTMEELIKALKVIKNECNKHVFCIECPLGNDSDKCCVKTTTPGCWKIIEPEEIFRVIEKDE